MSSGPTSAPPSIHLERLSTFYSTISQQSVPQLRDLYAADAYFKDPFNEVTGIEHIIKIFTHMFVQIDQPKFEVLSRIQGRDGQHNEAFLIWLFYWKPSQPGIDTPPIRGSSHLKFNELGQVVYHRDYWDAAEELYETVPFLGTLLRFLKKKLSAA
jgi:steroid Delta-isomerase